MKKLRVGVVGVGYLGKFHAEKYAAMDDVDLVGVTDINRKQVEKIAKEVGTTGYTDYRKLFGKVDAVSIVVPTPLHYRIGKDFLENDVDMLLEKPMTESLNEADELIDIAESRGLIIQVGHLERYNPAVVPLKNIVKKPRFIESHRLSVYNERGTDVSVVLDLMIHDIDIILNYVGSEVKAINAAGISVISQYPDIANARIEFKNGCVANVTASRISGKNERKIRLFQKDAYISVDFANREINIVKKGNDSGNANLIPGMTSDLLRFTDGDALEDELKAFVKNVKRREVPEVSGRVGREALKIALSIMDQINTTSNMVKVG
jgi:predicted dehydrogenase